MGNQVNTSNESVANLCQFNIQQQSFMDTNVKALAQTDNLANKKYPNDIQDLSDTPIQTYHQHQSQCKQILMQKGHINEQKAQNNSINIEKKSTKRNLGIQTLSKKPFPKNQPIKSQQQMYKQRIQKGLTYFKSLNTLHLFETTFNLSFPILIRNKNKQTTSLRKEIVTQKHAHPYFITSSIQPNHQEVLSHDQNPKLLEEKYKLYSLLQKLERNLIKIFETNRHSNVLKEITELDNQVGLNPTVQNMEQLHKFIEKINQINFEFLDMLHYQLSYLNPNFKPHPASSQKFLNTRSPLPILDVKQFMMRRQVNRQQSVQKLKKIGMELYRENKVCFYILAGKNQTALFNHCPPCKTRSNLVQTFQNVNLSQKQHKFNQFQRLNLPKNTTLFQILLDRYSAFSQILQINQITIIVFANEAKIYKINQLSLKNAGRWKKINLIVFKQSQMPCLSINGNLILTKVLKKAQNQGVSNDVLKEQVGNLRKQLEPMQVSTGTGDLWDMLKQEHNQEGLKYLRNHKFEYIQVIGTQNCLQQCFDCFMLGQIHAQQLCWGTKVVEACHLLSQMQRKKCKTFHPSNRNIHGSNYQKDDCSFESINAQAQFNAELSLATFYHDTLIFQGDNNTLETLPQNDQFYHQKLQKLLSQQTPIYSFANHSIFKVDFIQTKINNPLWQQSVTFTKKTILTPNHNQPIIFFQKDLTDIFKPFPKSLNPLPIIDEKIISQSHEMFQDDQFMLFKYEREDDYYPLLFLQNKGIFDVEGASRALTAKFMRFLQISIEKYIGNRHDQVEANLLKCYIDPHVTLEGQDLAQIKLQIQKRVNLALVGKSGKQNFQFCQSQIISQLDGSPRKLMQRQKLDRNQNRPKQKESQVLNLLCQIKEISIERGFLQRDLQQSDGQKVLESEIDLQQISIYIN